MQNEKNHRDREAVKKQQAIQYENELKPMELNQLNDEIDIALADSENDRVVKATELKEKWVS